MMIYDKKAAAGRLRGRRKELKLSAAAVANLIGKTPRYYCDIERGICGMSVETLIALSKCLDLSLDYILFGDVDEGKGDDDVPKVAYRLLSQYGGDTQKDAVVMLKTFLNLVDK